jgi:hypothetical protein
MTARSPTASHNPSQRHREERSDAAIHAATNLWIAAAYGLAMIESAFCKKF